MMPYLASPRQANGPLRPPAPGSIASSGRRTSWSLMSHWIEARIESLGVMSVAENPRVSVGTRKPRTGLFSSSVRAQTTATSAMVASPIQRFSPFKTQSEPSFLAKVFMLAGSEPAVGSVRPKQPIVSPLAIGGSHLCFWSSDPNLWMALMASEPCTLTKVLRPESPASSSMQANQYSTALRELGYYLLREDGLVIPPFDVRFDPLLHKGSDLLPYASLLFGEVGVDVQEIYRIGAGRGAGGLRSSDLGHSHLLTSLGASPSTRIIPQRSSPRCEHLL